MEIINLKPLFWGFSVVINSIQIVSFPFILFADFLVPKATSDFYKPSFIGSVYESHIVMAQVCWFFLPFCLFYF